MQNIHSSHLTAPAIILCFAALLIQFVAVEVGAAGNSITSPDPDGIDGSYSSLVLDSNGFPVASFIDGNGSHSRGLVILHCNDADCAGQNESIMDPVSSRSFRGSSLVLDSDGYPVVAFIGGGFLQLLHCNDPNCGGNDESSTLPNDLVSVMSEDISLVLDASGHPVIVYYDGLLRVMHCNDPNCAGDDESVTAPNTLTNGTYNSLALDSNGYPVVSFYLPSESGLKILHCNDANCAGDDESLTSPDPAEEVGDQTSLALDSNNFPVVSYHDLDKADLKILHCNDPDCAGGDESITSPDTDNAGWDTSLQLDSNGFPVVSYFGAGFLRILRCNDPDCAGDDDSIANADTGHGFEYHTSLRLDASGFPVVTYMRHDSSSITVLHCGSSDCVAPPTATATPTALNTETPSATASPTISATPVSSATATASITATPSPQPSATPSATSNPVASVTTGSTVIPSQTAVSTPVATPSSTATAQPTAAWRLLPFILFGPSPTPERPPA